MAEPFLGEIRVFPFGYAPSGWAKCNGQLLQIQQNQALYALLGVTYGGDGRNTFALPNLQGRVPLNVSDAHPYGQVGGEEAHTLTISEIPQHTHEISGSSDPASTKVATGNVWGTTASTQPVYTANSTGTMSENALGTAGSSQAHSNMQPFTVVNFCIALQGIFPPRN